MEATDRPSYVETIRPIYEPEEIGAMLKHADPDEAILLKFCLASGLGDREIRYVTWRDLDFRNSVVRVTAKPGQPVLGRLGLLYRLPPRQEPMWSAYSAIAT